MGENSSLRKMLVGAVLLAITSIFAVGVYMFHGWDLLDSVYMVVITIFGVGYGEVRPVNSPGLKIFTGFLVIAGCSAGIYVVGGFVQMIAEGEIHRALGARRMSHGIKQLNNHVIICGFGRVGQILAAELKQLEQAFVCVDSNQERIMKAEEKGFLVVLGNAGDEDTLVQAGIERARVVAAVLPDDAANVFITLTVRELREDIEIIARGESVATQRKLLRSGATHVVLPAAIGASKIANMIACPTADALIADIQQRERLNTGLASLGLALREVKVEGNAVAAKCRIADLELSHAGCTLIAAIRSADGTTRYNPGSEETIVAGDILYIVSHAETIQAVIKQAQVKKKEIYYRGARTSS